MVVTRRQKARMAENNTMNMQTSDITTPTMAANAKISTLKDQLTFQLSPEQVVSAISLFDGIKWERWIAEFEAIVFNFSEIDPIRKGLLLWSRLSTKSRAKGETSRFYPLSETPNYEKFKVFMKGCYPEQLREKAHLWSFNSAVTRYKKNETTLREFILEYKMHYHELTTEEEIHPADEDRICDTLLRGVSQEIRKKIIMKLMGNEDPTASDIIRAAEQLTILPKFSKNFGFGEEQLVEQHRNPSHQNPNNQKRNFFKSETRPQHVQNNRNAQNITRHNGNHSQQNQNVQKKCIYCQNSNHYLRDCYIRKDHLEKGYIRLGENFRMFLRNGTTPIPLSRDQKMCDYVLQKIKENEKRPQINSVRIRTEENAPKNDLENAKELISTDLDNIMKIMTNKITEKFIPTTTTLMRNEAAKDAFEEFKKSQIPLEIRHFLSNPDFIRLINEEHKNLRAKFDQHEIKVQQISVNAECMKSLSPLYIRVEINEQIVPALLDGGSQVNMLSAEMTKQLQLHPNVKVDETYQGVNGDETEFLGGINGVHVRIGSIKKKIFFYIADEATEQLILGRPFIKEFGVMQNAKKEPETVIISDKNVEVEIQTYTNQHKAAKEIFDVILDNNPILFQQKNREKIYEITLCPKLSVASKAKKLAVQTVRKRVADKIRPQNIQLPKNSRLETGTKIERPLITDRLTTENIKKIQFSDFLLEKEKLVFLQRLHEVQGALGFSIEHLGILAEGIEKPVTIHTVPHQPWTLKPLPFSQIQYEALTKIVQERLNLGLMEYSQSPYSNRYFLIPKKNGTWRFIQDVRELNKVSIKDCNIPPNIDDLIERFAGYPVYTTMDCMSGYDQIPLDENSRDYTSMITPMGNVRSTRIPMGYTNSVAIYERVLNRILGDMKGKIVDNMIDDIIVKNPSRENDETIINGCRKFILTHIECVIRVLKRLQEANIVVSVEKSIFGTNVADILGSTVHKDGREPDKKRLSKIANWSLPKNVKELRGFLALCNGIHPYVPMLSEWCSPLTDKLKGVKKNSQDKIKWSESEETQFKKIKNVIAMQGYLQPPNYDSDAPKFILYTDAGEYAAGAVLMQESNRKLLPIRFESRTFNDSQRNYTIPRKELLAILIALNKMRKYIQGRRFILRTDSRVAVGMLNNPSAIPDPLTNRWVAYCLMFDFELQHVNREENVLADIMTRLHETCNIQPGQNAETHIVSTLEKGIAHVLSVYVDVPPPKRSIREILREQKEYHDVKMGLDDYSSNHKNIIQYLQTTEVPKEVGNLLEFKKEALQYCWVDNRLWYKGKDNIMKLVIDNKKLRTTILEKAHVELGHFGSKQLYLHLKRRVYWSTLKHDAKLFVKQCDTCQKYSKNVPLAPLGARPIQNVMEEIAMDHVLIDGNAKNKYLIVIRCTMTSWLEGLPVPDTKARRVVDFLIHEIFPRHANIRRIISDNGSIGSSSVKECIAKYGIEFRHTNPYNPRGNGVVERGNEPIIRSLGTLTKGIPNTWTKYWPLVLWADRVMIRENGYSAYQLLYGKDPFMAIDYYFKTWPINISYPQNSEELIVTRVKQLQELENHQNLAMLQTENLRSQYKNYKSTRKEDEMPKVGDYVLVRASDVEENKGMKLRPRWTGPYYCEKIIGNTFQLADLNGNQIRNLVSGHRIKKYFLQHEEEETLTTPRTSIPENSSASKKRKVGVNSVRIKTKKEISRNAENGFQLQLFRLLRDNGISSEIFQAYCDSEKGRIMSCDFMNQEDLKDINRQLEPISWTTPQESPAFPPYSKEKNNYFDEELSFLNPSKKILITMTVIPWELIAVRAVSNPLQILENFPSVQEFFEVIKEMPRSLLDMFGNLPRHKTPWINIEFNEDMVDRVQDVLCPILNNSRARDAIRLYFLKYRLHRYQPGRQEEKLRLVFNSLQFATLLRLNGYLHQKPSRFFFEMLIMECAAAAQRSRTPPLQIPHELWQYADEKQRSRPSMSSTEGTPAHKKKEMNEVISVIPQTPIRPVQLKPPVIEPTPITQFKGYYQALSEEEKLKALRKLLD